MKKKKRIVCASNKNSTSVWKEKWNRTNFIGAFCVHGTSICFPNKNTHSHTHANTCMSIYILLSSGHFFLATGVFFPDIGWIFVEPNHRHPFYWLFNSISENVCVWVYLFDWSQVAFSAACFFLSIFFFFFFILFIVLLIRQKYYLVIEFHFVSQLY